MWVGAEAFADNGHSPLNSSIVGLLVKPRVCYCHASKAVPVISSSGTHISTHTLAPSRVSLNTWEESTS